MKNPGSAEGILDFLGALRDLIAKGVNITILVGSVTETAASCLLRI